MVKSKIRRGYRIARYIVYKETLVDSVENFWSFAGAFLGVGLIAFLQSTLSESDNLFLIGSFGASAVLIFGAIQSPLAQPRNLVGGHVISALLGVSICQLFPTIIWLTAPLAVGLSIISMQITKTLHPPGGATALIAVIGSEKIKDLGYWFVLTPVASGVCILLAVALVFNNLTPNRRYPTGRRFSKTFKWVIIPTQKIMKRMRVKRQVV
ncbi:HPP family protein [Runella slithyformis]|uniref:HPP family protein n=1 Tax=Runella slithyformis (strain ATCC 29530 / DSM 19594 / LMG 11500 / NCIMB 11436 / LSU 4) TaxID=761193 RepID=A0A7U3ZLA1_RUNSL|nr:HPP family protein [Runella slithyformis]AEI49291.1 HPP family protein [Runella slithyformis DSM 19594]